jgi:acetolactate synthase-1/2/3 large subunit
MLIKLSDYVAQYLVKIGVDTVFAVSGGASLHLIHAIGDNPSIRFVTPHHEQAAAMAADGYARTVNNIGVAVATSGPGATNLITGMCCSFYDSVPVLFITGQVSTFRMTGSTGVRQIGFQETPIVDICKTITKYAVTILDPSLILYELEKAIFIARSGRPGPVLIDIPDNLQRAMIDESKLVGYHAEVSNIPNEDDAIQSSVIDKVLNLVKTSERPIIVAGWGLHLSGMEKSFIQFAESLNIPVAFTWGASDILPYDHPLYVGTFGTHGTRHANFAVQNADLIISLGSRLDTKATGSPINSFARKAKKVVVDIDASELKKFEFFELIVDVLINDSLQNFFKIFSKIKLSTQRKEYREWFDKINYWRAVSINARDAEPKCKNDVDPYEFIEAFSKKVNPGARIFVDTGCSIAWTMQVAKFKDGARVFHDFNNTAMGWALPASIGSYFAHNAGPIYCVVGDGSLMMTMHELATIKHHKIPVKIFLMNNSGYGMIKQTQDQWLSSIYYASSHEGGLSFPDYRNLADAFSLEYCEINSPHNFMEKLEYINSAPHAILCNVIIPRNARVSPQVKFGCPNEDMEPLLDRDLFNECMIIPQMSDGASR